MWAFVSPVVHCFQTTFFVSDPSFYQNMLAYSIVSQKCALTFSAVGYMGMKFLSQLGVAIFKTLFLKTHFCISNTSRYLICNYGTDNKW